jgi:uncharacterized membrane protein (DUF441 family)
MTLSFVNCIRISAIIVGTITGVAFLVEGIPSGNLKDICVGVAVLYVGFVKGLWPFVIDARRMGKRR